MLSLIAVSCREIFVCRSTHKYLARDICMSFDTQVSRNNPPPTLGEVLEEARVSSTSAAFSDADRAETATTSQ